MSAKHTAGPWGAQSARIYGDTFVADLFDDFDRVLTQVRDTLALAEGKEKPDAN